MKIKEIRALIRNYEEDSRTTADTNEIRRLRFFIKSKHDDEELNFETYKKSGAVTNKFLDKPSLGVEIIFNPWKQADSQKNTVAVTDTVTEKKDDQKAVKKEAKEKEEKKRADDKDTKKDIKLSQASSATVIAKKQDEKIESKDEKRSPYKNKETFLNRTSVLEIDDKDLIVLDGYAFDVTELQMFAERELAKFYINPHEQIDAKGKAYFIEFSDEAKKLLRKHPALSAYAEKLDKQLSEQSKEVTDEFLDKLQELLDTYLKIGRLGKDGKKKSTFSFSKEELALCEIAKSKFSEYFSTLSEKQRKAINDYIISVSTQDGGKQNQRMGGVLMGTIPCIITEQIYEWQFMKDHRPKIVVPPEIVNHAQNQLPFPFQNGMMGPGNLPFELFDLDGLPINPMFASGQAHSHSHAHGHAHVHAHGHGGGQAHAPHPFGFGLSSSDLDLQDALFLEAYFGHRHNANILPLNGDSKDSKQQTIGHDPKDAHHTHPAQGRRFAFSADEAVSLVESDDEYEDEEDDYEAQQERAAIELSLKLAHRSHSSADHESKRKDSKRAPDAKEKESKHDDTTEQRASVTAKTTAPKNPLSSSTFSLPSDTFDVDNPGRSNSRAQDRSQSFFTPQGQLREKTPEAVLRPSDSKQKTMEAESKDADRVHRPTSTRVEADLEEQTSIAKAISLSLQPQPEVEDEERQLEQAIQLSLQAQPKQKSSQPLLSASGSSRPAGSLSSPLQSQPSSKSDKEQKESKEKDVPKDKDGEDSYQERTFMGTEKNADDLDQDEESKWESRKEDDDDEINEAFKLSVELQADGQTESTSEPSSPSLAQRPSLPPSAKKDDAKRDDAKRDDKRTDPSSGTRATAGTQLTSSHNPSFFAPAPDHSEYNQLLAAADDEDTNRAFDFLHSLQHDSM